VNTFSESDPEFDALDRSDDAEALDSEQLRESVLADIAKDILSEDVEKRHRALSLIENFECDPRLADLFTTLLNSTDADHIRTAVTGLGIWKHSDGVALLINFLTSAKNKDMITEPLEEEIIISIGMIGGTDALEFLENYAKQRFDFHVPDADNLGMAAIEGITQIAAKGHTRALNFLMQGCGHPSWNMRESCADSFSVLFKGKEKMPKPVYDLLMRLSQDENRNVRIAAYLSLDEIVGLDEANKKILAEARHQQIFGN
jgi:HEAT repeat protein